MPSYIATELLENPLSFEELLINMYRAILTTEFLIAY